MAADLGAPDMEEARRLSNVVMEAVGEVDMVTFITVLVNLGGQIVAELSERKPSLIQQHADSFAENLKIVAIEKLMRDDAARRIQQKEESNGDPV